MPGVQDLPTHQERVAATEYARTGARFKFARDRITKIADGTPPFSRAQLTELAGILLSAAGDDDA